MKYYKTANEAIQNAEKDYGSFIEEFDGKNCDECPGWESGERRCVCGNRRVMWFHYKSSDGWYVVAEAW